MKKKKYIKIDGKTKLSDIFDEALLIAKAEGYEEVVFICPMNIGNKNKGVIFEKKE